MVSISASIDNAEMAGLQSALLKYADALDGNMGKAVKVTSLAVCDSLRARTKKAPKKARPAEYRAVVSPVPPHYITYRRGVKLDPPLHRWQLTRKLGTPAEYTKQHFVYVHTKAKKNGKITQDRAAELRELKKLHLGISRAGLAKASWGWMKKDIAGHGGDSVWSKHNGDRRDPRDYVRGMFQSIKNALTSEATAKLKNHLDYIEAALKPGAVAEACVAVTKTIEWKILQTAAKL